MRERIETFGGTLAVEIALGAIAALAGEARGEGPHGGRAEAIEAGLL
jgi:hypothetical protein